MKTENSSHSRRQFIKGAGLAGLATSLIPIPSAAATEKTRGEAKNLIFLVVDGMCHGTLGLAHHWNIRNHSQQLHRMQLYGRPDLHLSTQDTASNNSPVTDSAAAASAWGCGHRVNNGSINIGPSGKPLTPIFSRAKKAGKRTGLVSTCRISHATPAGFAANVANRGNEKAIIAQYLTREVDLLLGGGAKYFTQSRDGSKVDHFKAFADAGYVIVRDKDELKRLPQRGKGLLGIFSDSHIPYAIDRQNDPALAQTPDLAQMFSAALDQLKGSKDGFILQVEAGRVDHAGHANDPGAILHELLDYDRCIPLALEFIDKNPDTMLIVTTDHGTGGCQLNGAGSQYKDSGPALDRINRFRYSFEWLEKHFRAAGKFEASLFTEATGLTASADQADQVQAAIDNPNTGYLSSVMTGIFSDELLKMSAVGWSTSNHTAENAELLTFGPGSERVPAFIRNDELFGIMTDALKI